MEEVIWKTRNQKNYERTGNNPRSRVCGNSESAPADTDCRAPGLAIE